METDEWSQKVARFHHAHANPTAGFNAAIGELQSRRKVGHWVWYIFAQLQGLGKSAFEALVEGGVSSQAAVAARFDR